MSDPIGGAASLIWSVYLGSSDGLHTAHESSETYGLSAPVISVKNQIYLLTVSAAIQSGGCTFFFLLLMILDSKKESYFAD